ncbi:MAG: proline iminopeptidase-family hydrolase [candidate division Zixibacteria bacterium]
MNKRLLFLTAAGLLLLAISGCGQSDSLSAGEGFIDVTGGKVWYNIVGSGSNTPLLLLHGGPGVPSFYLNPLKGLAEDRPVIFYDQLGCGRSDKTSDSSFWTIEHFVRELGEVRKALKLDEIHLYGHSWGTMLATDYLLTKPNGVKSVIFASPALDTKRWIHDTDSLRSTLPDSIQQIFRKSEETKTFDSPEFQAAVFEFYKQFLARRRPLSADMDSGRALISDEIYLYMWGPSEFIATGTLKNYDRTDRLGEIKLPTLFTVGQYDECTPATAKYYQSLIPGAELVIIENAGHITMHDEPEANNKAIREFLHKVESE